MPITVVSVRIPWLGRLAIAAVAALAFGLVCLPASARAAVHQNAEMSSYWTWNGSATNFWNVDQHLRIDTKGRSTYWAQTARWSGQNHGAVFGLQTNGNHVGGNGDGDLANFSIVNATAASGNCTTFSDGGQSGYRCSIPYPIVESRYYRLRIWRLNADGQGQWWGAWVLDETTGIERQIGSIRAPAARTTIGSTSNWIKYFGGKVDCGYVPRSVAVWTQPAANQQQPGTYEHGSTYSHSTNGSCVYGSTTAENLGWTRGVKVVHGTRVQKQTPVVFVHGFEFLQNSNCDGTWGDMLSELKWGGLGWTHPLVPMNYYTDDKPCTSFSTVDIGDEGDHGYLSADHEQGSHTINTEIKHLAHHWAWTVYERYSKLDRPVDAVAHSMGGLIVRSALREVAAGNPNFPPKLLVEDVVTLGTPHNGADLLTLSGCAVVLNLGGAPAPTQCREMRSGSLFLDDLEANGQNPQGLGGTEWTLMGSTEDRTVSDSSARSMRAAEKISYKSGNGIEHGDFMHEVSHSTSPYPQRWLFDGKYYCGTGYYWPVKATSEALSQSFNPC